MRRLFYMVLLIGLAMIRCAHPDHKSTLSVNGNITRIDLFPSTKIDPRAIDIWVPSDYDSTKNYAVLYMHDAQMLFDSTQTWNKKEWQVDETITKLIKEGKMRNVIVVGIENNGSLRAGEYFPEAVLADVPEEVRVQLKDFLGGDPLADEYLMFLVHELKPYVDSAYSTLAGPDHTFLMGSSMGGLISLYAVCEYPKIFGGAACLSTHWPLAIPQQEPTFDIPSTFRQYLDNYLPSPSNHKFYFDHGTATLDSFYKPHQNLIDSIMVKHGYTSENWMTKEFPGDEHSEVAWARRLHVPLEFLFGN